MAVINMLPQSLGSRGIIPKGYELQSTSMGYTFGGFDGVRIPLVEQKKVSVTVGAGDWTTITEGNPSNNWGKTKTGNRVTVEARTQTYNNQNLAYGRAKFNGGTFESTDQLIWLGTDYEELKRKTSGTIVVWLEPTR